MMAASAVLLLGGTVEGRTGVIGLIAVTVLGVYTVLRIASKGLAKEVVIALSVLAAIVAVVAALVPQDSNGQKSQQQPTKATDR
jgi:hypothetical protein